MTDEQLTIDGGAVPLPVPMTRRMTPRQRDLWLWAAIKPSKTITVAEARRFYADPGGALRRLEAFGAMRRVGRGRWAAS